MFRIRSNQKRFKNANSFYAYSILSGKSDGSVFDPINDIVLVKDTTTPANNFIGTMSQALDRGILVYPSAPTKLLRNSYGIWTSGTDLRCHHSATGTPLGFLPEPQRTNLITYSEQIDNAAWTKRSNTGVQANAAVAPDGTTTADRIYDSAGTPTSGTYARRNNITPANSTIYVFSAYVKKSQRQKVSLTSYAKSSVSDYIKATFDFDAVTLTETIGGAAADTASGFEDVGNGWYRVWVRINSGTGAVAIPCELASPYGIIDGSGTYDFFAWGAQLEAGLFPTSPIVTAGSTVTRAADNLYVDLTKVPFNAAAYTIIAHAQPSPDSATNEHTLFTIHDTTANERFLIRNGAAGAAALQAVSAYSGTTVVGLTALSTATAAFKAAFAGQADNFQFVIDGVSKGTDTSGAMPASSTRLQVGGAYNNTLHYSAPIGLVYMIPERLTQANMITRTS